MSAKEIIEQINALPDDELNKFFAGLAENENLREDLLDILLIASRRNEPAEPLDKVFRELGIQA